MSGRSCTGLDPLANERIWHVLYWTLSGGAQVQYASWAISAIDTAIWDIKGKALNDADLEAPRRRAREGAGLRHHRRAGRRHRAIVRSRAAAGGDGLHLPEDAGRPPRPRQPARPEADDRDRAQRRAPHQGAARGARRRHRDRHRRAVPARPLACDGAGAADRALSRELLRGAAGAERRAADGRHAPAHHHAAPCRPGGRAWASASATC